MNSIRKHLLINIAIELGGFPNRMGQIQQTLDFIYCWLLLKNDKMEKFIWIIMAFIAGSFLPIQSGMNNKLAKTGGSPVHASMISFAIGLLALVIYIILTSQNVSWTPRLMLG